VFIFLRGFVCVCVCVCVCVGVCGCVCVCVGGGWGGVLLRRAVARADIASCKCRRSCERSKEGDEHHE